MKKTILTLALIAVLYPAFGQKSQLYLIAGQGCPGNCMDEYSIHYPVHLFTIKNDSLNKISDLAKGLEFVFKIATYNDFKKGIIYKSELFTNKKNIIIIDYNKELKIDTITRTFPTEAFLDFMFYIIDIGEPYIIIKYFPNFNENRDSAYFYGINLATFKDTLFNNDIIKYLHSEGEQAIAMVEGTSDYSEILKFRNFTGENIVFHKIIYPHLRNDTVIYNIPNLHGLYKRDNSIKIASKNNGFRSFQILNNNFLVFRNQFNWDNTKNKGNYTFLIYDYEIDTWYESPLINSSYFYGIKCYNDWITGYFAGRYQWGFQQKMKLNGSIPGEKYRQKTSMYGSTFDERAKEYQLYPEGVLYLLNLKTLKYIEWDAKENGEFQGNSEVLLIANEIVYYRINDKIYKAPIIDGQKLGKTELLIQDDRVQDIHWAFISEN